MRFDDPTDTDAPTLPARPERPTAKHTSAPEASPMRSLERRPSLTPRDAAPEAPAPATPTPPDPATSAPRPAAPSGRKPGERSSVAIGDLGQQLAATQAQVASLSAQLTTLAHRLTYDLERGAQTTSERLQRDLSQISEQITHQVGLHLGPAIDDLTDQVEADRERLLKLVEGDLAARLTSLGDAVDAMPVGNVELVSTIEAIGADLQDRMTRFATRMSDQVAAIETSTAAELSRLREHLDEVQTSLTKSGPERDAIERMAGQVERLVQRPATVSEIVDAVEALIDEHLEVIRDNLDARVSALAPALHEELEAVRAEALAGITATEEGLAERIEAFEHTVAGRIDAALGDQLDALDNLVSDRHAQLLGTLSKLSEERLDEVAATASLDRERLDEVLAAVAALEGGRGAEDDPFATITEELQALRRRIKVRFETGEGAGLSPEQVKDLAAQVAAHLR